MNKEKQKTYSSKKAEKNLSPGEQFLVAIKIKPEKRCCLLLV